MPAPWQSALDRPSVRDSAMLAEVLRTLQQQLQGEDPLPDATAAEVQDLVSHAVAELQRLQSTQPQLAGIAPVLGSGVLQELLRQQRDKLAQAKPAPTQVDTRR